MGHLTVFRFAHLKKEAKISIGIDNIVKRNIIGKIDNNAPIKDSDFVNTLMAVFHENRHVQTVMQEFYCCRDNKNDDYYMAINCLVCNYNDQYYDYNYNDSPWEIDAEQSAIFETYKFLKDEFPNCNYEELILNYVNERCDNGKYKITKVNGGYRTLKEINDAFNEAYEQSKSKLRFFERNDNNFVINKIVNKEEWNDVLRKIEKMNEESNEKNIGLKRDEMLASLMCYFCPEYKNKIKSLENEDLSAQKIFGIASFPEYSLEMEADEEEIDYI